MALCLTLTAGSLYSGTTTTTIRIASGSATAISKVPYSTSTAVFSGGLYSCPLNTYLLVSPDEYNASASSSPFVATPDHYIAVTAVFAAAITAMSVIWGVKKMIQLFNNHTEA